MKKQNYFKSELFLKIILIFSLFVILLIGGITFRHVSNLTASQKLLVNTSKVNLQLKLIMSHLRDAESLNKNYVVTRDTSYINIYLETKEKVNATFVGLSELVKINKEQRQHLKVLNELIENLYVQFSKINTFVITDETATEAFKTLYFEEKIIMDSIRQQTDTIFNLESKLLDDRQKKYQVDLRFTPLFFYVILLLTLVLIIITYQKISNDLKLITAKNDQLLIFKEASKQNEIIGKHGNWIWHVDTNTFTYSDNLYRLLGEEPQSFKATLKNFLKFVHPEDVSKLNDSLKQMTATEELPFITYRIIKKNGAIVYLKAYGKSFFGHDGQKRVLGNTTDITEEIESFLELEERNLELERNNTELTAFNYAASHDLQEPLRKVQTFISRLEEKETSKFSESGNQYIEGIKSAVARMRLLIDDLIQFSKANKPNEAFVNTDLNELLENAKQEIAEIIVEKKAKITNDELPRATIIPFQIQQLFLNLLSNSLKYSREGIKPQITIDYSKVKSTDEPNLAKVVKGDYHKITFADNGIGFDQKYSKKIFELFSRLHNKQDYSGTGIGLSICKKIVENHKGYIFAHGKLNEGSVFTIYIAAQ